jgi:hypothetical protein
VLDLPAKTQKVVQKLIQQTVLRTVRVTVKGMPVQAPIVREVALPAALVAMRRVKLVMRVKPRALAQLLDLTAKTQQVPKKAFQRIVQGIVQTVVQVKAQEMTRRVLKAAQRAALAAMRRVKLVMQVKPKALAPPLVHVLDLRAKTQKVAQKAIQGTVRRKVQRVGQVWVQGLTLQARILRKVARRSALEAV